MRREIVEIIRQEYNIIFKNRGVMLILIIAPLLYAFLYSSGYAKQLLEKVPISIVDNSNSYSSRQLATMLNSSPFLKIAYSVTDIEQAKRLLYDRDIYAIVYIPHQYETKLLRGEQATLSLYFDGSYFLMYRQAFQGVMDVISTINQSKAPQSNINYHARTLFNPDLGYGTFIMPAILLVILQQTALMAIGVVGGIWSERRLYNNYSTLPIFMAKSVVYLSICVLIASYITTIHYHIFGYPANGSIFALMAVMIPYILSFIFLGIALSTLFKQSEAPLLTLIWTSIPILLLSGASLPPQAFPQWLFWIGKIIPSSSAVSAYIGVQTMGCNTSQITQHTTTLWSLVIIYALLAIVLIKRRMPRRTTKS